MYDQNQIDLETIDLSKEAPVEEPGRQYYYMAKCLEKVKELKNQLGRPATACVVNFGCQMNARDSEKLRGILGEIGYQMSDTEDADFVIYNTCTVRENANLKVYGHLGYLRKRKKSKSPQNDRSVRLYDAGTPGSGEDQNAAIRFVDLIFGTHNLYKFAELLVIWRMEF